MNVFVQSIPRSTATGVSELVNPNSGKKSNKTKMGNCSDSFQALYSPKVGGLATGLTDAWVEDGVQVIDEVTKRPLLIQHKMERKHNLPDGFLNNKPWMKGDSDDEKNWTYYQRKYVTLNDGSTVFNTDEMEGELSYYILLASKYVANSEKEWRDHKWPDARWYIALENEEDELKATKSRQKSKCIAFLVDDEFSLTYQQKFVHVLGLATVSASLTTDAIYNLLKDYIDASNYLPGSNIEKFQELQELLKTPLGREEFEARHLLKRSIDGRVVREKQGAYIWDRPDGPLRLGENYREAVEYLLDPKKEAMVEDLLAELKLKGA